jgi:hypothetical protein
MTTFLVKYVWLFAGLSLAIGTPFEGEHPQNQPVKLIIDRRVKSNKCMRGYLKTKRSDEKDAKVQCLVAEIPQIGATPTMNTIPAGTYTVKVRVDGDRGWRLEIMGVPGGKSVFIRLGNCPQNTINCLLPGTRAGDDECTVAETPAAMIALKDVFQVFGSLGETMITIQ